MIGWWKLDDSGGAVDSSGQGNNGTLQGTTFSSSCHLSGCRQFNGTSDYISTTTNYGNASSLQTFTIAAWFKTSTASGHKIMGLEVRQTGQGSPTYDRHLYVSTDGKLYFGVFDDSSHLAISSGTVTDGVWHHAVGVCSSNSTIKLYLDGVLQQTTGVGVPYSLYGSSYWRIGSWSNSGQWINAADGYFPGYIDDVRIYNRALTAGDVTELYNYGVMPHRISINGRAHIVGFHVKRGTP